MILGRIIFWSLLNLENKVGGSTGDNIGRRTQTQANIKTLNISVSQENKEKTTALQRAVEYYRGGKGGIMVVLLVVVMCVDGWIGLFGLKLIKFDPIPRTLFCGGSKH